MQVIKECKPRPTHPGAEDIVGRLRPEVQQWAKEYSVLAEKAWWSPEYEWAREFSGAVRSEATSSGSGDKERRKGSSSAGEEL